MDSHRRLAVVILTMLVVSSTQGIAGQADRPGWKLTFDDEFDGKTLDLKKWTPADPWGRERNRELQAYVPDAFEVKNGMLRVKAEKRAATYDGTERAFTSGMMTTYKKFAQQYGRFEIRCRVPTGKGFWPAFWLLPDPLGWPPEFDVLEILGHEPQKVYFTHHFRNDQGQHKSDGGSWIGPDFSTGFHEFAIEWTAQRVTWFVDGVQRFQSEKSVPQVKMYLLVNLAVGGDWPGAPSDQTQFPNSFDVDYVRVYQKAQPED